MREIIDSLTQEEKDALDRQWYASLSDSMKELIPHFNEVIRDVNAKGEMQFWEMTIPAQIRVLHGYKLKGFNPICKARCVGEKDTRYGVFSRLVKKGILFMERKSFNDEELTSFGLTDFGVCVLDEIGIDFRTERKRIFERPRFRLDISKN